MLETVDILMRVKSERVNLEGKLNIRINILNDARINNIPLDDTSRVPENAQRVLDITKYVKKKTIMHGKR